MEVTTSAMALRSAVRVTSRPRMDRDSCDDLRQRCGITRVILPPHLYVDAEQPYDKSGNPILPNGQRLRGELFDDESVQKVLAPVLHLFTSRVKYPRTFHLPWSPGVTDDDRVLDDPDAAFGESRVVVTEKMDGECTTMYRDYLHARSTDYSPHPSRDRVRALHAQIAHDIPEGWRVCGENVYAQHSISYDALPSYFLRVLDLERSERVFVLGGHAAVVAAPRPRCCSRSLSWALEQPLRAGAR